ncbi:MAG: hypothetical protein KDD46_04650 [Bdellovibrionales bacterium]|nr:hypothetical protein [Bdellovibrionales bacterium]
MSTGNFEKTEKVQSLEKIRLNAENIRPFLFGFEPLVADLLWIYSTVEMDIMLPSQEEYNLYYMIAHLSTDLDPYFEPLYIYTANQFLFGRQGREGYPEALQDSQDILLKGWNFYINRTEEWDHYSRFWIIPQLIGFNYYFEYKNLEKALPYYEFIANHVPHAPPMYRTFAAEIYKKLNRKEDNIKLLENVLAQETLEEQLALNRDNEELKEKIRLKMIQVQGGSISKEEIDAYLDKVMRRSQRIVEEWATNYQYLTFPIFLSLHSKLYQENLSSDIRVYDVLFNHQGDIL